MQHTLFDHLPDSEPRARHSDPDTSHAAAASVRRIADTHRALLALFEWHPAMTDEQILDQYTTLRTMMDWPRQSPSGLRTRRSELVQAGLIGDSGQRARTTSGRACIIWQATGSSHES